MDIHAGTATGRDTAQLYFMLEERTMAPDQVGASEVFHDGVRADRPL
jgi:hypothetical protein